MARTTKRTCSTPGCPQIATYRGKCHPCAIRSDRARGTAVERGYDSRWRNIRNRYLKAHPTCQRCGAKAVDVHHRDGTGPRGNNAWENLEALCKPCHSRHTAKEQGFARGSR